MKNSNPSDSRLSMPDRIAREIQHDIVTTRHPGDRLPTVVELASQFKVSKHSITNALDILARTGLITKGRRKGVHVADLGIKRRIGILSELNLLDHRIGPHFRSVACALQSQLEELDFEAHLYVGNAAPGVQAQDEPTCPWFWADAAGGRLDGAVILNTPFTPSWYERVHNLTLPAVGWMTDFQVETNTAGVTAAAVRRLAERGCRRLGLLSWKSVEPFRQAVKDYGLITNDTWIRSDRNPSVRGAGRDAFREVWSAAGEKPDGMVVLDDMLFTEAQLAIFELRVRVPQDLQLVVLTSRNASPPIHLPVDVFENDPADVAGALIEFLMKRLRGETLAPVTRLHSFREIPAETARGTDPSCEVRQ